MPLKENVNIIFRFWTWKKFILNFIFFALLELSITLLFESSEFFKSTDSLSPSKTAINVLLNTLIFSFAVTVWAAEKGSLFELLIAKLRKKTTND